MPFGGEGGIKIESFQCVWVALQQLKTDKGVFYYPDDLK